VIKIVPLDLKEANSMVARLHRHHKPVVGHRFSLGVIDIDGNIRGCAIASRPIARLSNQKFTLEVTRVATDGTRNACSMLLGAITRAARAMGYARVQTTTLSHESGSSLRAIGWNSCALNQDGSGWDSRKGRIVDCKDQKKVRWWIDIREVPELQKMKINETVDSDGLFEQCQ